MPTLPRDAADPEARRRALERSREDYRYDHSYAGYTFAAELQRGDHFDLAYLSGAIENKLRVASNRAASRLSTWAEEEWAAAKAELKTRYEAEGELGAGALLRARDPELRVDPRHPATLADYDAMFPLLPDPSSMGLWREDWFFAWQRIAGCNPMLIERARSVPQRMRLNEAKLAGVLGTDSLAAAAAEGRLFLVDHGMLAGVPAGQTDGRLKYLDAPLSLYLRRLDGLLMPVAIQCAPEPGPNNPVYTPIDGHAWDMAKLAVQIADANFQGVISHLGHCHLVMEVVILATRRQLAEQHPLRVLLEPHFEHTLAVNQVALEQLISPNGNMDRLQSGTLAGSHALVLDTISRYAIDRIDAPTSFADRGVDDREGLPCYPFRDDAMSAWGPILSFVRAYVELYYHSSADVAGDAELQAWLRELQAREGGRLHRVHGGDRVETVEALTMIFARFIYQCTAYHAAINYSSWDYLGYMPNMPGAGWAPGPSAGGPGASEEALLAMMSPLDTGFELIDLMYSISMRCNRLGEYPRGHFEDARVAPLVARLQRELDAAQAEIEARNLSRPLAYPYLLPANITASIHV